MKVHVQRPVWIKPCNAITWLISQLCEIPAHQDFPICLNRECCHRAVRTRIEISIQSAIRIHTSKVVSRLPRKLCEHASNKQLSIGLPHNAVDSVIDQGIENSWSGIVSIKVIAICRNNCKFTTTKNRCIEITCHNKITVPLLRLRKNSAISLRIKKLVTLPIGKQLRQMRSRIAVQFSKKATQNQFTITLRDDAMNCIIQNGLKISIERTIQIQSRNIVSGKIICIKWRVHSRKNTAQHPFTIRLQRKAHHSTTSLRIKCKIQRAIDFQPGKITSSSTTDRAKNPSHEDVAIRQRNNNRNRPVNIGIEAGIQITCGVEAGNIISNRPKKLAETSSNDNFPIWLNHQAAHNPGDLLIATGIEESVQPPGRINPCDIPPWLPTNLQDAAADHNLSIRLNCNRGYASATGYHLGIEAGIQRSIGIQPYKIGTRLTIDRGKVATNQNFSVWLSHYALDGSATGSSEHRTETEIERAVGIESCDTTTALTSHLTEISRYQHLAVRLNGKSKDVAIGTWVECYIQRSVRIDPGDPVANLPANLSESPAQDHSAVWLGQQTGHGSIGRRIEAIGNVLGRRPLRQQETPDKRQAQQDPRGHVEKTREKVLQARSRTTHTAQAWH